MLNKKQRNKMLRQLDTLVGQHTQVEGNITFDGGLRVDGSIIGNVAARDDNNAVLTLSEAGKIEGDIRVANMIVNGTIIGNIHASGHLELSERTQITGNVYYGLLQMEEGAQINGKLIHIKDNDSLISIDQEGDQVMLAGKDTDTNKP